MSNVGQLERKTQNRVVKFFKEQLDYDYLGDWEYREGNSNIETDLLIKWLKSRKVSEALIKRTLRKLDAAAALGEGKKLYDANKEVYRLLRYGVKEKEGTGEQNQTVWLIDWENPEANNFAIAEEVTVKGEQLSPKRKRPDIVIYVNGIALGVIELKRSSVSVSEGIRQNLDNQKKAFIRNFFTTMQITMAGNDTQGIRYGTIETSEKYYLEWKEPDDSGSLPSADVTTETLLDTHLAQLCDKGRFLQLVHDYIVFDAGVKKTCRHNQFFGIQAAKKHVKSKQDGIIWHTQG